jgi:hypothetical protein
VRIRTEIETQRGAGNGRRITNNDSSLQELASLKETHESLDNEFQVLSEAIPSLKEENLI